MAEKNDIKKEENKEELPKDTFVYKRDHSKSLRQIASEASMRQREEVKQKEEKKEEKKEEPKKEEPKKEEVKKEEPKAPSLDEVAAKVKEDAAKAAEEAARKAFKEETEKILSQNKSMEEKQKEQDELIDIWTKEKRIPKDYKEVVAETLRLSEAKFKQLEKERAERQVQEAEEAKKKDAEQKTQLQQEQQRRVDEINRNVQTGLETLYQNKFLKKPADPKEIEKDDTKDEGAIETRKLLLFGIELNKKRAAEKLPPVASVTDLYFIHYKPYMEAQEKKNDDQPPGADAPISGAKSSPSREPSNKGYVYSRDHGKTYRQLLQEGLKRMRKS